ncbi:MAG: hydroxymethylbilane synthase, partial [bacterium]
MTLRLGTRGSPLALAQAELTTVALSAAAPGLTVERVVIATTGDRTAQEGAPADGQGIFVKEIEEALLARTIDVAVHSLRDLPVEAPARLVVAAVLPRADVRDAFCSRDGRTLDELEAGAVVATGSPRRVAQLRRLYPRLVYAPIRGNVNTRLRKIRDGEAAGTILARAGLVRLGLEAAVTEVLSLETCLPAPGQGAVGLEARADDPGTLALLEKIHDAATGRAVTAERALLAALGGGCRTPLAAYAAADGPRLRLLAFDGEAAGVR